MQSVNVTPSLFDYAYGDYANGSPPFGSDGVGSQVSCLQFSAPYISSGFALISIATAAPFDPMTALFSADVCNAVTVIIIITCSAGFLVSLLERRNMHLGTFSRGVYWGLLTFLAAAEEQPRQKMARVIMILYILANIGTCSTARACCIWAHTRAPRATWQCRCLSSRPSSAPS